MKDESLIEEMRAALRNDQDRAEARRQTAPLGRHDAGSPGVTSTKSEATAQGLRNHLGRLFGRGRSAS